MKIQPPSKAGTINRLIDLVTKENRYSDYGVVIFCEGGGKVTRAFPDRERGFDINSVEKMTILTGGHHNVLGVASINIDSFRRAGGVLEKATGGQTRVFAGQAPVNGREAISALIDQGFLKPEGSVGLEHRFCCTAVKWDAKWNRAIVCAGGCGSDFVAEVWKNGRRTNAARIPEDEMEDLPDIDGQGFIISDPRTGQIDFDAGIKAHWQRECREQTPVSTSISPEM